MSTETTITRPMVSTNRENLLRMTTHHCNEHELFASTMTDDTPTPLSETVTTLASNVYKELERIIRQFGENSVKDLMPVMISILESLDGALHDRDVSKMENESFKEQNEQLFQQYEREKTLHKEYQQRYLQTEDHLEEMKRENEEKLSSLESIVKIFEIKARNSSDHIGRLEEKENDMKQEYKRLHDRYSELFKAHCDYMERMKILHGTDHRPEQSNNPNSRSRGQVSNPSTAKSNESTCEQITPPHSDISFTSHNQPVVSANFSPELDPADVKHTQTESMGSNDAAVNTGIFSKLRSLKLLSAPFDEQQFFVNEDEFDQANPNTDPTGSDDDDDDISVDDAKNLDAFDKETRNDNIDITDVDASADLFVRQSFYGMTKEVSNLIKENNELLETKNALNVLKDDLLMKIEEFSNEQEILREEVESLQTVKQRLQSKMLETDEELRKTRDELDKKKKEEKPLMLSKGIQTIVQQQTGQEHSLVSTSDARVSMSTSKSLWRMFSDDWLPTTIVPTNILGVPVVDIQSDLREGTTQISEFFSDLFGSGMKDDSSATNKTSASAVAITAVKHNLNSDQMASTRDKHDMTRDDRRSSERAITDRFGEDNCTNDSS